MIYTDRDEYTWRYEGGELAQIVITREEADARQKQADEAMALMQQAAQARTDAGLWGSENEWEDDFLPTQGENGGLNLMWGDYQATIEYEDAARMDAHVVSAGYQAFIENGDAHDEAEAENVLLHRLSFVFRLTDSTPNLYLASENPEAIRAVTVHKVGAGVLSADLCAYAALVGAVLTALLVLSWDQTERGRKNRRDMAVVLCAAAFACMPLLWRGVYDGHDLFFHLNRIEGIANGLRNGQFPVRIHSSTLLGYGYAAPEFYPELFLYFPALLRNLGVSLCACVRVFEACIHLATAVSCYLCVRGMMNSRRVAVGASVLYTLCIYRLVNVYTRATLGESLAMVFFPVVMLGLYEVLRRDEKKWPLLALGMTGVCMSHLLSTMFCVLFCAIAALASAGKLLARKRRILAVLAAAGVTALCALCVIFSGYTMQTMVQRAPELEKETYTDTRIGQFEYTYPCTEKTALKVGDVRTSQPGVCSVLSYEKRGTELTATVQLEGEAAYIELPLLYYPGYRAEIDGQAQTVARGTNNMVRVYGLSSGESGTVHVWYQPPTAWLIAQGASVLGALLLAASLRRMRRRA